MRAVPSARRFATIMTLLVGSGFLSWVLAFDQPRRAGRFADSHLPRQGGAIAVEPRALERLDSTDELRQNWEAFKVAQGGSWTIYLDERTAMPLLVSGRGIEWVQESQRSTIGLADLELKARAFLAQQHGLLGNWATMLELDLEASAELRKGYWQLVFRQVVDGVPVENARLEFHVNNGRMAMFGAKHWGTPTTNGVPTIDAVEARKSLDLYLGESTALYEQVGEPSLALIALDPASTPADPRAWDGPRGQGLEHALVWRIRFRMPGEAPLWVGEIDAHDGSVRAFFDGAHYEKVQGGVFPISNDGDCVAGGCEIPGFPMPFADYTETGQPETFSDPYGNLACSDPSTSFQTTLTGQYVHVVDQCGTLAEAGGCEGGVDLGMKDGENCAVQAGASAGNTAAARTTFYHINRIAEAARFYDPTNSWLQSPVTVNVNIDSACNAFWDGDINMYGAGNGCGNTGEQQGVLVHEWGHGYDQNDGGGFDNSSEAYADVVSMLAARDSCISRGLYADGRTCTGYGDTCLTCTGLRDHDWAAREMNTPATPAGFIGPRCPGNGAWGPCRRETHCEAYPVGETIFDLATRDLPASGMDPDSAWQLVERLWYDTRPGSGGDIYFCLLPTSNSCGASSWFQRMRVADDDDGDLSNGTPHAAELYAAFARHGIACGRPDDATHQSTSGCPTLAAPFLDVAELPSGTQLRWNAVAGAGEYRVYRGDLGCNRQQVPIASLTGGETNFLDVDADPNVPRYYRVEVLGANAACSSPVSNCEATPAFARLQKSDFRVIEPGPEINGIPDPGETVQLPVTLFNNGTIDALSVSGRLQLTDPTQGRVLEHEADWADVGAGQAEESMAPHFQVTVFEEVRCGETLAFDFEGTAANTAAHRSGIVIPLGNPQRDFPNDQPEVIPPDPGLPVTSTLLVEDDAVIADLDVSVWIGHGTTNELIVELTSPDGTTVRLHDQSSTGTYGINTRYDAQSQPDGPGAMGDFVGESTQGTWTLSVEDVGTASTGDGTLNEWTLHFLVDGAFGCIPRMCPEPTPTEAPDLSVEIAAGGAGTDLLLSWTPIAAAGYHVLQSTTAAFDATVALLGRPTTMTTWTVPDGVNSTPALTFFQIRGVNACNQEGP